MSYCHAIRSYVSSFFRKIISLHIWIALASLCMSYTSYKIMNQPVSFAALAGGFIYALSAYAYIRAIEKKGIFWENIRSIWAPLFVSATYGAVIIYYRLFPLCSFLFLAQASVVTLVYRFPSGVKNSLPLRSHYRKVFVISYAWLCVTFFFPLCGKLGFSLFGWAALERFIYVCALCLIYDVKDIEKDRREGTKTFALALSPLVLKGVYIGLLLLSCALSLLNYDAPISAAICISNIAAMLLVVHAYKAIDKDIYFLGWVDGQMILQAALVWMMSR